MTQPTEMRLLKIGAFAELAGTNLRTLRYYEELGLLVPARRSAGGLRFYRETDVNRWRMVQTMRELGLRLDRIAELLATHDARLSRHDLQARVRAALAEQDRLCAEKEARLAEQRRRIAEALAKLSECESCRHGPSPENNFCEPCAVDGKPLPPDLSALY
jgi:DNA-binding transcriptional MerR regulator